MDEVGWVTNLFVDARSLPDLRTSILTTQLFLEYPSDRIWNNLASPAGFYLRIQQHSIIARVKLDAQE
jgi:hypothetical protein